MDRISGLPDHILHSIVAFLPTKSAIQTSVLSKKFRSLWYTCPVLDFDTTSWGNWSGYMGRVRFLEYMHECIQRRTATNLDLQKFRLCVNSRMDFNSRVDEAIAYAIDHRVKELDLSFYTSPVRGYMMPPRVLSRSTSLTVLKLHGFNLKYQAEVNLPLIEELKLTSCDMKSSLQITSERLKSAALLNCSGLSQIDISSPDLTSFFYQGTSLWSKPFEINMIDCTSLKDFGLMKAGVTSECFNSHVSKFLLLQNLKLISCNKMEDISLPCPNLKTLEIGYCDVLETVVTETPKLESFVYRGSNQNRFCEIEISDSRLLKVLKIHKASITDGWVEKILSCSPNLETLRLSSCLLLVNIMVYHDGLKHFELERCQNLEEAVFDAPNLTSFKYVGGVDPVISIDSPGVEAEINLYEFYPEIPYREVRNFLEWFDHCKTLTILTRDIKFLVVPKDLREQLHPPLYEMRHLTLSTFTAEDDLIELVDSVLWLSPHLKTLTLVPSFGDQNSKLQLHYLAIAPYGEVDPLLGWGEAILCCHNRTVKCWRHYLYKVSVENFVDSDQIMLREYFSHQAVRLQYIVAPSSTEEA